MTRIEELKSLSVQDRHSSLAALYQKNLEYFKTEHPDIYRGLTTYNFPYEVVVDETFLDIIDQRTGKSCFEDVSLENLAQHLGGLTHQTWNDLMEFRPKKYSPEHHHARIYTEFTQKLIDAFPPFSTRFPQNNVYLADGQEGKKFSNPTIFVGLFHGLHIDHYLHLANLREVMFIEPEPERFEVSCYFLDYQKLDEQFDGILIHVGPEPTNEFFRIFFQKTFITSNVWVRVLFGYSSEINGKLLLSIQARWKALSDQWYPADWRLNGYNNVLTNLEQQRKFIHSLPKLSKKSKIAVIGAGPSLNEDLAWLKKNQSKVLIFATHSAVRPLASVGLSPDLQFCLDIHLTEEGFNKLQLRKDIPIILEARVSPTFASFFDEPLLVSGVGEDYPVQFNVSLKETIPTTGNFCFSFASHLKPTTLYLLGLDFGFRDLQKSHASGGHYDEVESHEEGAGKTQVYAIPNFPSTKDLITRPYFDEARIKVEDLIAEMSGGKIYNLSDGAKIRGTIGKKSQTISLPAYPQKAQDQEKILNSFSIATENRHYRTLHDTIEEKLSRYLSAVKSVFQSEDFCWENFAKNIDQAIVDITVEEYKRDPEDNRIRPLNDITRDLFLSWYKFMAFTHNKEEAQDLYIKGRKIFFSALDKYSALFLKKS